MLAAPMPNRFRPVPGRSHKITITPSHTLPGTVIIHFDGQGLEYTTSGGNVGYLLQDGCRSEELPAHLALLERTHGVRLIVMRQVPQ